jgi:hypothetical protein
MSGMTSVEREGRLKRAELLRVEAAAWAGDLEIEKYADAKHVQIASQAILALCALAQLEIELAREGWRTNR